MTIKFRGKSIKTGEWAYGSYINLSNADPEPVHLIVNDLDDLQEYYDHQIDPKTLGQYTNLNDKNDNEIYFGDIVDGCEVVWKEKVSTQWNGDGKYYVTGWFVKFKEDDNDYFTYYPLEEGGEIIGNTTDNSELLNNK